MSGPIIGIDPGVSGGIALIDSGSIFLRPFKKGECPSEALNEVVGLCFEPPTTVIERVGGFIGKPQPGSAMFRFGQHAGFLQGWLSGRQIKTVFVTPQTWQKGLTGLQPSGPERKRGLCAEAKRLFPHSKVTLATCDALLIANWMKKQ